MLGTMRALHQSLQDTDPIRLRVIAQFWEISLTSTRPREMAHELAEAMISSNAVAAALERLTDDQRQALQALIDSGGQMPQRIFSREWGSIRAMGPGRMDRERPWEDPASPAEALWYHGLLFKSFEEGPDGAYNAVRIPPEIQDFMPRTGESRPTISVKPAPSPNVVSSSGDKLLEDACTLLAYVHNQRPSWSPDGAWSEHHTDRLLSRLLDQRSDRFAFLSHLASRIGWVVGEERGRLSLHPETVTSWLRRTPSEQRSAVTRCWRDDPTWNDLSQVPTLQPVETGVWRNDPLLAREAIFRHLTSYVSPHWYEIESFIAFIKELDPDFQRPSGDYETWYIRDEVTGLYLSGFESWDAVEGRLIRYMLTGPLAWLGLIEVGAEEKGHSPRAFRLTDDGAAYLDLKTAQPPAEPPKPRLRSGFRISVPLGRRYARFQIARVADWLQNGDHFIYRLTPTSLQRARRQHISVARVLEFLEEVTEAPLPQPVKEAVNRWDRQGTEASLRLAVVLRLADVEQMDRAVSVPRLSRLIEERIGPTAALVKREDWHRVITALEEMGFLPDARKLPR